MYHNLKPIDSSLWKILQIIYGNGPSKSNCCKVVTVGRHASLAKTKSLKEYENQFYIQCDHTETPTSRITSNCMYGCSIPRNGQTLITH